MQRVIQRTERAKRTVARKLAKAQEHKERGESWARTQDRVRLAAFYGENIRNARKNRQHDWETGSLAPRRDVGTKAQTYGAFTTYNFALPDRDPKHRPKGHNIKEGDRVVVLKGRERGKIGQVRDLNEEKGSVTIKSVNMIDVHVAEWMSKEENVEGGIQSTEQAVLLEDVRLVYPLPDPETGVPRDVIVEKMNLINRKYDKTEKKWTDGDRVIAGTNTIIPWPEKAEDTYEDYEDDTLRISVEEQTFRPFLLHPPMPLSVIDELRHRYSKFRTRHDWEYIDKKELEEAKEGKRKELIQGMRTPLQELAEVRRQRKEQEDKHRELTDEQLARIGEVIAQERAKAFGAVKQMEQS